MAKVPNQREAMFRETANSVGAGAADGGFEEITRLMQLKDDDVMTGNSARAKEMRRSGMVNVGEGMRDGKTSEEIEKEEAKKTQDARTISAVLDDVLDSSATAPSWVNNTINYVTEKAQTVWNGVTTAWDKVGGQIKGFWDDAKGKVQNMASSAYDYTADAASSAYEAVVPEGLRTGIKNGANYVKDAAVTAWDAAGNALTSAGNAVSDNVNSVASYASNKFTSAKNFLFGGAEKTADAAVAANENDTIAKATVPAATPLVGTNNDIERKSVASLRASFKDSADPSADNSNSPQIAPQAPAPSKNNYIFASP